MNLKQNNTGVPGLGVEYQNSLNEPDQDSLALAFTKSSTF